MFKNLLSATIGALLIASITYGARRGGGSDGGGNSYKGKPLESYAKNPQQLASYKEVIAPIFADLEKKDPYNSKKLLVLKNLMESVFKNKIWYFVPGPLSHIPADLLHSVVPTDQAALQGFDRVWIDEDIWNTMSVSDQGQLLLHEVFMGLKIIRFSDARQCEAAYPEDGDCFDEVNFDEKIVLNSRDYFEVQKMTIQVRNHFSEMTSDDWLKLIRSNGLYFNSDWFNEVKFISPKQLGDMLWQSTISNKLPVYGYNIGKLGDTSFSSPEDRYNKIKRVKEKCSVEASVSENTLHLKQNAVLSGLNLHIPLEDNIETTFGRDHFSNRQLQKIGMFHATGLKRPTGGYLGFIISFGFDYYDLANVYIQEMVCDTPSCEGASSIRGGFTYLCTSDNNLFKP